MAAIPAKNKRDCRSSDLSPNAMLMVEDVIHTRLPSRGEWSAKTSPASLVLTTPMTGAGNGSGSGNDNGNGNGNGVSGAFRKP